MSLFDLIKHPVVDILDPYEMATIPQDILESWGTWMMDYVGYCSTDRSVNIHWAAVPGWAIQYYVTKWYHDNNQELINTLKDLFTQELRYRIKIYEE